MLDFLYFCYGFEVIILNISFETWTLYIYMHELEILLYTWIENLHDTWIALKLLIFLLYDIKLQILIDCK